MVLLWMGRWLDWFRLTILYRVFDYVLRFEPFAKMRFLDFLIEARKKEKKIVFIETDGRSPFPKDTITSINKEINKNCKNLEKEWKNATEVVNYSLNELDIPIPTANLTARWDQYKDFLKYAVKNLADARGVNGSWSTTI